MGKERYVFNNQRASMPGVHALLEADICPACIIQSLVEKIYTGKFIIIVPPYNMGGLVFYILFLVDVGGVFVCFFDPVQHHCCACLIPGIFITIPRIFFAWIYYLQHFHTLFLSFLLYIAEGNNMPRYYSYKLDLRRSVGYP